MGGTAGWHALSLRRAWAANSSTPITEHRGVPPAGVSGVIAAGLDFRTRATIFRVPAEPLEWFESPASMGPPDRSSRKVAMRLSRYILRNRFPEITAAFLLGIVASGATAEGLTGEKIFRDE